MVRPMVLGNAITKVLLFIVSSSLRGVNYPILFSMLLLQKFRYSINRVSVQTFNAVRRVASSDDS